MKKGHRILLCDDQELVRSSVHRALRNESGIQVIGEAASGAAGITAATQLLPDLVLMDVSMPGVDGREATREIVARAPEVKVLAYSAEAKWEVVEQMFAAGAHGFVLKQNNHAELIRGIRTVLAGGSFLSAGIIGCTSDHAEEGPAQAGGD